MKRDGLSKRDRIILNEKFRYLVQVDFSRAIKMHLLADPISKHIYKLRAKGSVQLRPMLCKGPINNDTEYTLLLGAVEKGGKLPAGSELQAENNRQMVIQSLSRRQRHEPIT